MKTILFALPLALLVGCASTQTAITKDVAAVNGAAAVVTTVAQAASQMAITASGTLNGVVNNGMAALNTVEALSGTAAALATQAKLATHYGNYTVVRGDTLWAISHRQYQTGFLWPFLCAQNGLANCALIVPGQNVRYALPDLLATYTPQQLAPYQQQAYAAK